MPPKKSKGNKKAKKKHRKKKRPKEEIPTFVYTKEKILQLQKYVVESYGRVYDLRVRALHLRELTKEAVDEIETLRQDHIEYQEAMKARTEARGALVVKARMRLSSEVAKAEEQRQEQIAVIEEKMKQLEMEKVEQEAKLERLKIVLIDMEPFGVQKQQQKELIKQLEEDFKTLQLQQDEELNKDKADFVRVRKELEEKYNSDTAKVKKAANKMIGPCLEFQLNQIGQSNSRLQYQLHQVTLRQRSLMGTKTKSSMHRDLAVRQYEFWEGIGRPSRKTVYVQSTRKRSLVPRPNTVSSFVSSSSSNSEYKLDQLASFTQL